MNDTVVVYDRIRENQAKYKGKGLGEIVDLSINEVFGRTLLTSVATALSLDGLLVYGVGTIFDSPSRCSSASSPARTPRGSSPAR